MVYYSFHTKLHAAQSPFPVSERGLFFETAAIYNCGTGHMHKKTSYEHPITRLNRMVVGYAFYIANITNVWFNYRAAG